jgi:hypothetical protein
LKEDESAKAAVKADAVEDIESARRRRRSREAASEH